MKIKQIDISNFKGLKEAQFNPESFTCIVGENNAGKSTALQALVYALNRPKNIPNAVFYDDTEPVIFRITFSGIKEGDLRRLTPEHKTKLQPLVYGGELTLVLQYKKDGLELYVSKLVPSEEKYREENVNENLKGLRSFTQIQNAITEQYPEFAQDLPDSVNLSAAKEYLRDCINALNEESFEYTDTALPSGIPSSIAALIPEPIYIPAVKNFTDDLKTTQSTSFGRLIGLLTEDLTPDLDDINKTLVDLKNRLNRYKDENGTIQDNRLPKVKELEKTIEAFLSENFPNVSVDLEILPPEIKTILNTAQIYVDDGSRDLVDNKGDGVKRSLTFSLLRTYVELLSQRRGADSDPDGDEVLERPLIFLFEEPELYLHPKAQRVLFQTLASISETHQTVITTHSPLFFEPGVTAQFLRIAKEPAEPKPIGRLYPVNFRTDEESLNTFRMAKYDHAEAAFFSSHIVLYEGESDDFFFRHLAKTIRQEWNFDEKNIALVEVGGKGNFSKFRKFFESFGLRVSILSDLDVLVKGFNHLGANPDSDQMRQTLMTALDTKINQTGITPQLTGKRVKKKVNSSTWVQKYDAAKEVINTIMADGTVNDEQKQTLESLFVWENEEARYTALKCDDIQTDLVSLLDSLRSQGIYILSKGAIEEYYPNEMTTNCSKPERALKVVDSISTSEEALSLSSPLVDGRQTEFEEIFSGIFGPVN